MFKKEKKNSGLERKKVQIAKSIISICIILLLIFSNVLSAQGRRDWAFEHVREVQERNSERFIQKKDIEGTAIGYDRNGQPVIKVFTSKPGVYGIPSDIEGVSVENIVTGKFWVLRPSFDKSENIGNPLKDHTPPSAPKDLKMIVQGSDQIYLYWNHNKESDLAYYNIYRFNH